MTTRTARPLAGAAAAALVLGGFALAGAPAAYAAPGDNGDVKIHKATTSSDNPKNEPKVGCEFRLAAFNFDTIQEVTWEITPQPPKADDPSLNGAITLNGGKGHTGKLKLPTGQYKLVWTFEGENGAGKQKVFKVDCPGDVVTNPPHNGHGHHRPPHGPVGAGGGGSAPIAAEDSSAFGVGAAVAAGLAGTAGLVLIRRARRRDDGAA